MRELFYSREGASHLEFYSHHSWSLFAHLKDGSQVKLVFIVSFLAYVAYTIGWKTRWVQWVSLFLYASWIHWNPALIHGGNYILVLFLLWSAGIPLGKTLSLDSFLGTNKKSKSENVILVSPLPLFGLRIQFAWIYFASFLAKVGVGTSGIALSSLPWINGRAVRLILSNFTYGTGVISRATLDSVPSNFFRIVTWSTLLFECLVPIALILFLNIRGVRRICFIAILIFCLCTGTFLRIGDIPVLMFTGSAIFVQSEDWKSLLTKQSNQNYFSQLNFIYSRRALEFLPSLVWLALIYSNIWTSVENVRRAQIISWARPTELIYLEQRLVGIQRWDFFWNGPLGNESYELIGVNLKGNRIDLDPLLFDPQKKQSSQIGESEIGILNHYGLLRFRFLDAFFNFNFPEWASSLPPDLFTFCRFLKHRSELQLQENLASLTLTRITWPIRELEDKTNQFPIPPNSDRYSIQCPLNSSIILPGIND